MVSGKMMPYFFGKAGPRGHPC
ncbi:protein of unknown function [Streptomyces sp. KY75]|nr:protein of unknown function [Streptomyces sp. KY75]